MNTKNLTLLFIAFLVIGCAEGLTPEDINPEAELTDITSSTRTLGESFVDGECDPYYEFQTIDQGTPGYHSIVVTYDATLTEEEVHCARYDFFMTYPGLFMGTLQSTDIHLDNWLIADGAVLVSYYPNRLRIGGKIDVDTAICIDPRTGSTNCN